LPSLVTDLEVAYLDLELKNEIITSSINKQQSFIFPEFTNLLTSIVRDPVYNTKYLALEIFKDYFKEDCHAPIFKTETEKNLYDRAFTCVIGGNGDSTQVNCPAPCSTITLAGDRTLENYPNTPLVDLPSGTEPWPNPKPVPKPAAELFIRNLYFGDVVSLFYYRELGLFAIINKLIEHYDLSGKYLIPNDGLSGILLQKCSELMRKLEYPFVSSLQLEGLFLRVLGWQSTNVTRKIDSNLIMRNSAFGTLMSTLIPQVLHLYSQTQVIDAITLAKAVPPAESEIAIQSTLATLKTTMENFNSNTEWYLTLNAYLWLICGLSLLERNLDALGVPTPLRDHPMHYIPFVYDLLVGKNSSFIPKTQNRYLSYLPLITSLRSILFDLESLNLGDHRMIRLFIAKNTSKFLAFKDSYNSVYGINLGATEYRTQGTLRFPHEAI
jgi:hypothetical protein